MASLAEVRIEATVRDSSGVIHHMEQTIRFAPGAGASGKFEEVSLTASTFTALSPPSGAKAVLIQIPSTATSLVLKGVTGDSASITLAPSSGYIGGIQHFTLGASPVVGILNSSTSAVVVEILWL